MNLVARGLYLAAILAVAQAAPAWAQSTATPSPQPSSSPAPAMTYSVNISGYAFGASGAGAQLGNALFTATKNTGALRFDITAGAYAFPTVGQPLVPTFQSGANTALFSYVPIAYLQYVANSSLTFSAGKLPTLLGQEGIFTFQNVNVQRGLGWNMEPVVSRGIRGVYSNGNLTADLEINDGYYSGSKRALEGLIGLATSAASTVQFAFIVPDGNTPSNPTATVANKSEYNLMYSQTFGKLQLSPYLLFASSPASSAAGFTKTETASADVLLGSYAFDKSFSLGGRYEYVRNNSAQGDTSANADFIGYGPGSSATTWTLTPAYRYRQFTIRAEYSTVNANAFAQRRLGFEFAAQF